MKHATLAIVAAACAAFLVNAPRAEAASIVPNVGGPASVLYSQSQLVQGNQGQSMSIVVPSAGELLLTLTDLKFTSAFNALKFGISDSASALVGMADPGTLTLDVPGPTTLYAQVLASAQGSFNMGLYNLTATFLPGSSPVPVPASGWLLAAALGFGLWSMSRRSQRGLAQV